ncbi:hypothetical protein D3C78_1863510 [compost metagenome]
MFVRVLASGTSGRFSASWLARHLMSRVPSLAAVASFCRCEGSEASITRLRDDSFSSSPLSVSGGYAHTPATWVNRA